MQYPIKLLNNVRGLFTGSSGEEAWIDSEQLTPREAKVKHITQVLQWAAIVNGGLGMLLAIIVALTGNSQAGLTTALMSGLPVSSGTVTLYLILALLGNASLLMLLSVGAMAQEAWTLLLIVALGLLNIIGLIVWLFWPALLTLLPLVYVVYQAIQDIGAFHGNPVTIKELRGRMRGVRAFAIISIFLILMSSFTVLLYLLRLPEVAGQRTISPGELGRELFRGIVGVELLLVIFIVPALTAGAVTGERERKTYDLLQTTLLSAPSFLVGKMESALGYILLLLLSAIPLQSIAFLFGGVSEVEVVIAFVILVISGLVLGAMGLFFSALTERTLTATVRVYTVAVALIVGVPFLSFFLFQGAFGNAVAGIAPVVGSTPTLEATLIYLDMIAASLNPITAAFYSQQMLVDFQAVFVMDVQLASDGSSIPIIAPWVLMSGIYLAAAAVLMTLAVRRMRRGGV